MVRTVWAAVREAQEAAWKSMRRAEGAAVEATAAEERWVREKEGVRGVQEGEEVEQVRRQAAADR